MNNNYKQSQETTFYQLESVPCDFGIWNIEKESERELLLDYHQKRRNSADLIPRRDFGYVVKRSYRSSPPRQSKASKVFGKNFWILRAQNDQNCHGWVELDLMIGDFRDGQLTVEFPDNDLQTTQLESLITLISAIFIAYRLDRLRIFSVSEGFQSVMVSRDLGDQCEVLLGGYSGGFISRAMIETNSMSWWQKSWGKRQKEKLNYLQLRAERFYDNLHFIRYSQYAKPKKSGILSRFFSGGFGVSWGEGWSRWSKRP